MSSILVTGANGFIGSYLGKMLNELGHNCTAVVRQSGGESRDYKQIYSVGDISSFTNWSKILGGVDCIIHLAAKAHVLRTEEKNTLDGYISVNCDGTLKLAQQASNAGVKRFIYISSIGVLGRRTTTSAFNNQSIPNPIEPYAISKLNAENGLMAIAKESKMEVVIIRPPLVYGAGAPGNFKRLLWLVDNMTILPLGRLNAQKNMISLHNLCHFITHCIHQPNAVNKAFVVSDNAALSVNELIKMIANFMGKRVFNLPVPIIALKIAAQFARKSNAISKLSDALIIDPSETMEILNWQPEQTLEEGVKEAVDAYMKDKAVLL